VSDADTTRRDESAGTAILGLTADETFLRVVGTSGLVAALVVAVAPGVVPLAWVVPVLVTTWAATGAGLLGGGRSLRAVVVLVPGVAVAAVIGLVVPDVVVAVVSSLWTVGLLGVVAALLATKTMLQRDETETGPAVPRPKYDPPAVKRADHDSDVVVSNDGRIRTPLDDDTPRVVGAGIDEPLAALTDDRNPPTGVRRSGIVNGVRSDLKDTAVDVVADTASVDRVEAHRAVETGAWTDDHRAAAFLGDERAPPLPLWIRVADWLRGAPDVRHAEGAVDAIADRAEVRGDPPMRSETFGDEPTPTASDDRGDAVRDLEAALGVETDGGDES
jgi:hypothetical protein